MADDSPGPANLTVFESAPAASDEFDISDPELLGMLEASQRTHFWFTARNLQIADFLRRDGAPPPRRVLEVGCGTGTVLSSLRRAGYDALGVEMHAELARRAAAANPAGRIYSLDVRRPPAEFLREGPFEVVGAFDVVEHLEQPEEALRACAGLLRPGGLLVGTVPALPSLWSDYDAHAGHRLRYDADAIRALFERALLPVPRVSYFFQVLIPAMLGRRALIGRRGSQDVRQRRAAQHLALDTPGPFWNRALASACGLERWVRRLLPLVDGIPGASLWFSARISNPDAFREATPPTERTGGRS
ncbi:MAG TPA: class I SAM-dependent methyltransferase [Thermoanaerobaculia bacterium]|jgi:SAM-dependent methyltransferase|nr:class I SAM-dependent methyltransferase [Thermoanaerobaculia bacterium]